MGYVKSLDPSVAAGGTPTTPTNLLPASAGGSAAKIKRTSSTGVNFTTDGASSGQSIFIKSKLGNSGSLQVTAGSTQKGGAARSTFNTTAAANWNLKVTDSISADLNAKLGLTTGANNAATLKGTVGASGTYTQTLSPTNKASLTAGGTLDTSGVVGLAVSLKDTQTLGNLKVTASLNAEKSGGDPVVYSAGLGAEVPLNDTLGASFSVKQIINGGSSATAGVALSF